jgi:hypothetical protein
LNENEYNEKNIRRRVYDALNVFMALDIIARDKKEIRWKGLPITCKKDVEEVKMDRNKVMSSVQKKAAFLKELREKVIFFLFDGKFKYKTLLEFEILLCMSIDDKSY